MTAAASFSIAYPRRKPVRFLLRTLIRLGLAALTDMEVIGAENFPRQGPLLVTANHFNFLDPVAIIGITPWPLEYVGGTRMPNAPTSVTWLTRVYGVLPVRRGGMSREMLLAAEGVLKQDGVLGIFPEAGSWAAVLRPARPGTALLASRTRAQILPIGLDGFTDVFPTLRLGKRARVTVRVGKPYGPFYEGERGATDRRRLDEIGHEIMRHIAELIPPHRQGHYSPDPAIREAARGTEIYPWDGVIEE